MAFDLKKIFQLPKVNSVENEHELPVSVGTGADDTRKVSLASLYNWLLAKAKTDIGTLTKGDTGEKGLKGDQGEPGLQGERGERGERGAQGLKGDVGPQGAQGISGPKGDKGDAGGQGEQGPQGLQGDMGIPGADGLSAYELWQQAGNTGTEADFLSSLKGEKGDTGAQGVQGPAGTTDYTVLVNKPTTFPPSTHTHAIGEVSDLQDSLDTLTTKNTSQDAAIAKKLDKPTEPNNTADYVVLGDGGTKALEELGGLNLKPQKLTNPPLPNTLERDLKGELWNTNGDGVREPIKTSSFAPRHCIGFYSSNRMSYRLGTERGWWEDIHYNYKSNSKSLIKLDFAFEVEISVSSSVESDLNTLPFSFFPIDFFLHIDNVEYVSFMDVDTNSLSYDALLHQITGLSSSMFKYSPISISDDIYSRIFRLTHTEASVMSILSGDTPLSPNIINAAKTYVYTHEQNGSNVLEISYNNLRHSLYARTPTLGEFDLLNKNTDYKINTNIISCLNTYKYL